MSNVSIIYCPCGEPCGKEYSATGPTYASGGEIGYREGVGESFLADDGTWCCSEACLNAKMGEGPAQSTRQRRIDGWRK